MVVSLVLILVTALSACAAKAARPDPRNVLFQDNFSQDSSGWPRLQASTGIRAYADHSYQISVTEPGTLLLANPGKDFPGDVSITVDARKTGGPDDNYIGILCHYQNADNYYMLSITSDGYSGVSMRKDGQDTLISPGLKFLKMAGIKKGNATNALRADCIGESLSLYANGKQVSQAYNKSLTGGDAGLAVRSGKIPGGAAVRFEHFTVTSPAQP
jgi:hypothetical protein